MRLPQVCRDAKCAARASRRVRQGCEASARGIDELPSGALRVRVYAGMDAISKRRIYLNEVVRPGPRAGNEAERVKPLLPHPDPRPPSQEEAAWLVERAWSQDLDWGAFVWVKMTTGMRGGDLRPSVVTGGPRPGGADDPPHGVRRPARGVAGEGHQVTPAATRRLRPRDGHRTAGSPWACSGTRAAALGEPFIRNAFVFSTEPDSQLPFNPDTVTQRYRRMATRLGINTTLKTCGTTPRPS